ncbi:hypothetical protein EB232_06040 [Mesorhizobium sp. NZP2077]|nr:hypothetical protein EB232_06040 [Mesorhizobium sp. NZP2077]
MFFSKDWFYAATRGKTAANLSRFDARPAAAGQAVIEQLTKGCRQKPTAISPTWTWACRDSGQAEPRMVASENRSGAYLKYVSTVLLRRSRTGKRRKPLFEGRHHLNIDMP